MYLSIYHTYTIEAFIRQQQQRQQQQQQQQHTYGIWYDISNPEVKIAVRNNWTATAYTGVISATGTPDTRYH